MFLSLNTKKLFIKYFYNYKAKFFLLLAFIFLILILRYIGLEKYISFEKIKLYQYFLINFVSQNYFLSVLIYLFVFSISIVLFIPIAVIMNLVAGLLFGFFWGTIYVNIATVSGSSLVFLIFRYLLGDFVNKKHSDRIKNFNENIKKNGASYLLSMQLFPATPVFLINTLSGLTQISLWTFIWTTSIGILPGSLIYVYMGQQFLKMESTKDMLSWPIILIIILLGLLSLLPVLFSRFFNNK